MSIQLTTGRVLHCDAEGRPVVQLLASSGAQIIADWALPFRYLPAAGDLLLLLGRAGRYWVTGVVHGHGRSELAFAGDASLLARGGLRLRADGGVRVQSPRTELRAESLQTEATTIVQHAADMHTTVAGKLEERLGQCSRTIEGEDRQIAANHATVALRIVKIDGELLQIG